MLRSPLAEKRVLISLLKKQLIGRRAYSDSIYIKKTSATPPSLTPPSLTPSPTSTECPSPMSEHSIQDIQEKVFSGIGC